MAGIGETLRETRMRRRIDMSEVETATKIRAKYLRALENEEWGSLPGPTFVKSFLRTYAEYLGLDARAIVDEYRSAFERAPTTQELTPFGPGLGAQGRSRRQPRKPVGPVVLVVVVLLVLLGALYALGAWGGGADDEAAAPPPRTDTPVAASTATPTPTATATRTATATATPRKQRTTRRKRAARPTRAVVRITATSTVWTCLVDATGRAVVDARVLSAGQSTATFRSQRFTSNFGNGNVRFRVNGRTYRVPASSNPVGYEFRPGRAPIPISDAARSGLCA